MPKRSSWRLERATKAKQPGEPAARRAAAGEHGQEGKPAPPRDGTRSDSMRLAAEILRLQTELADMRAMLRELEARADIDPLTEIFNRRGFARELTRALAYVGRYGGGVALVYIDLDNFKPVNDRHGHAAGDAALKAVAVTLKHNVRASDTVARLGGDEFAVLLWNLSERDAFAKAEHLEQAIAAHGKLMTDAGDTLGASAGVVMPVPGETAADFSARADAAMYARKAARKRAR
jgi:diguanylate cyclase (GGDEF)-like protein